MIHGCVVLQLLLGLECVPGSPGLIRFMAALSCICSRRWNVRVVPRGLFHSRLHARTRLHMCLCLRMNSECEIGAHGKGRGWRWGRASGCASTFCPGLAPALGKKTCPQQRRIREREKKRKGRSKERKEKQTKTNEEKEKPEKKKKTATKLHKR